MASSKPRPIHEVRLGSVKAAVWQNETSSGTRYSVTLQRLYKDDSGKWQSSESFGRDDLPIVEKVCHMAYLYIHETMEERKAVQQESAA
ncbi:MAG: hypothetical protein KF708_07825 [Pirellulales bacterium]|nr:hypothetical protein [Pirellulales bacterium]